MRQLVGAVSLRTGATAAVYLSMVYLVDALPL